MASWPFPDERHVPGKTPRPEISPAFDAAKAAPAYTVDRMWQENLTYQYGVDLYNAAFFWEAHEVWEPVWMRSGGNSRERLLVQGLIQLSNGCLKIVMERQDAAARLLTIARDKIAEAEHGEPCMMGIALQSLRNDIEAFRSSLETSTCDGESLLRQRPELILS